MKSSPSQQDARAEAWTADFLVRGQALYHWATLPPYWYLSSYKAGKMLANLPHHSATLQGYPTDLRTFNIQESTTSIWQVDVLVTERSGKGGREINFRELVQPFWSKTQN